MKIESSVRVVTLGKVKRDGQNLKQFARFVIVLRNGVPELIDNGDRRRDGLLFARLIAVLGPVQHEGVLVSEAVLLEIGYSRTRPYAQLEVRERDEEGQRLKTERWWLKPRTRVRKLSAEELELIHALLEECMTQIVLECRETWKTKGRWWVPGPGAVERGIYFTFNKSDHLLYRQVLLEDIRFRREEYLYGHARRIRRLIGHYRYPDYSRSQLERWAGVGRVVELFRAQMYDNLYYRRVLLECFKAGSHIRNLLEHLSRLFHLRLEEGGEYAKVVYEDEEDAPKLQFWKRIRARVVDQPRRHARNGLVVELTLERKFRETHECPF